MNTLDYQKIKIEFLKKQKELDRQKMLNNKVSTTKKQSYIKRENYLNIFKVATFCFLSLTFICAL